MNLSRVVVVALCVLTALLVQATVLARIPAPGGRPDLVLVVVIAFALARGPAWGLVVGFGAGLLVDLVGVHAFGLAALSFCLVGYLAGLFADEVGRSVFAPVIVVAVGATLATALYAVVALLAGDPRVTAAALARGLPTGVLYDVVLAPFVVPLIMAVSRRFDSDQRRLR